MLSDSWSAKLMQGWSGPSIWDSTQTRSCASATAFQATRGHQTQRPQGDASLKATLNPKTDRHRTMHREQPHTGTQRGTHTHAKKRRKSHNAAALLLVLARVGSAHPVEVGLHHKRQKSALQVSFTDWRSDLVDEVNDSLTGQMSALKVSPKGRP